MNFRERFIGTILVILGLGLGFAIDAMGEVPGTFFKKNLAKCFYCDASDAIKPGFSVDTPQVQNARALMKIEESKAGINSNDLNSDRVIGVDEKAPLAFKELVRAYETGNTESAFKAAKSWVKYQDKILKRTTDIETLVRKARLELSSVTEKDPEQESNDYLLKLTKGETSERENPLKLYFFFGSGSAASEMAASQMEEFYKSSIANPDIQFEAIADGEISIEELRDFKNSLSVTFPIKFDEELATQLEVAQLPAIVAIKGAGVPPCRYQGSIESYKIEEFVEICKTQTGMGQE